MKKWPIILSIIVLLAAYAVFLVFWFNMERPEPEVEPTSTAALAAPEAESVPGSQTDTEPEPVPEPEETVDAFVQETTTVPSEPEPEAVEPPDETLLNARHAFVYDVTADKLLYTYGDQNEQISPASLTKLFTAYVALQYLEADTVVTVGEEVTWIASDSSVAAVNKGNRLTVEMIVQGMMMQSGNDAAYALAVAAGRTIVGNQELDARAALDEFMAEMNRQAVANGLTGTHFVTPDGYDAEGHYTTAADLLTIGKLAMTEELIVRYAAVSETVVTYESGESYTWKNTNWMIREEDHPDHYCIDATGLKTGGTSKAGMCILATFETGERTLLIGVLGCEEIAQRFDDALLLYDHFR